MNSKQHTITTSIKITPPVDYNYSTLPYHELEWTQLEELCYQIICAEYGPERCQMYGLRGQNQEGFDCYVRLDDESYILLQSKKATTFKGNDLKQALKIWKKGSWFPKTRSFIIFSSNSLQDTSFLDVFEDEKLKLAVNNTELDAWGTNRIDGKLKNQPYLVEQFFSPAWRDKFCNPLALRNYLGSFLPDLTHDYIVFRPVQFYISRRLTNPELTEEIYKGYYQAQRISLPSYISARLAENKLTRVIIKADAAVGKSKELENLAAIYSGEKNGLFPILIRFRNFHGEIDNYIEGFYPNWKQILPERLILLFDGLDEVPSTEFKKFIKKFNTFIQINTKINIIATIRTNVFTKEIGAEMDEKDRLCEIYLNDLEAEDVYDYLLERIPAEKQRRKLKKFFDKKWVSDLLSSPFYLSALTDLFLENENQLPVNKAEIIQKIMLYKIRKDDEKYGTEINLNQVKNFASKLALYLTLTGKNSLPAEQLNSFGTLTLDAIQRCSLFRVETQEFNSAISFEHNNFQEYLAAQSFSKLDWKALEKILFHTSGVRILKPKMFNTVNYLFTILKVSDPAFKKLFNFISETDNDLFLKFEKDKLSLPQRMEIFKRIILKGKSQQIYYLGGDIRLNEFCEFVNYSAEAYKFVLTELENADEDNHRYCLLDILYHYDQLKLGDDLRQNLMVIVEKIIKTKGYPYAVYDRAIDILAQYGFFNERLLKIVKQAPLNDHKMVRSAIIKYIDEGGFVKEFKYVVESDGVLTKSQNRILAGLESLYMSYVLRHLNHNNAIILLQHFKNVSQRIKEVTGYEGYSEEYRMINQIYKKLGDIYGETGDQHIYHLYVDFLVAINYADYKKKEWGTPGLFFSEQLNKASYFWDFVNHEHLDKLEFFLSVFYDDHMGQEVINRYKQGSITDAQVRLIRLSLENLQHASLQTLLLNNFGDKFKFQEQSDWQSINRQREIRNLELLKDYDQFLQEGKKVNQLIQTTEKENNSEDVVYELEYSERKEIQKQLNNTIILHAISDYKIKGGFSSFQKAFDRNGWEWYVFQTAGVHLHSNKKEIDPELLAFAKTYLLTNVLSKLDFDRAIKEGKDGSYTISNPASHLINYFLNSDVTFDTTTNLALLKLDYYGFGTDNHQDNQKDKKIYQLVHAKSNFQAFKFQILKNLQDPGLAERVITAQAAACLEYNIIEGLPIMLQRINDPKFSQRYKEYLIDIVIGLADGPEVFEDMIYSFTAIQTEWQYKICKYLYDCEFDLEQLKMLISKSSLKTTINNAEVYWKFGLLKLAIALGSKKATAYLFNTFFINKRRTSFLNAKPNWFLALSISNPSYLLKYCFRALTILAPTFKDERRSDLPEMLEETIRLCAVKSQQLFQTSLKNYEEIIAKNIVHNPGISYLRWYQRRLVQSYLTNAVSYESDEEAMLLMEKVLA